MRDHTVDRLTVGLVAGFVGVVDSVVRNSFDLVAAAGFAVGVVAVALAGIAVVAGVELAGTIPYRDWPPFGCSGAPFGPAVAVDVVAIADSSADQSAGQEP